MHRWVTIIILLHTLTHLGTASHTFYAQVGNYNNFIAYSLTNKMNLYKVLGVFDPLDKKLSYTVGPIVQ